MTEWSGLARNAIFIVHASLPDDATLQERKKALFGAYPFGKRKYWPYKAWLKAQREYLKRYDPNKAAPKHLSPLERQKELFEKQEQAA